MISSAIQVGYDPTVYTTSESMGFVVLNISVFSHPITGTPRPFTLSVTTQDGTAGMLKMIAIQWNPQLLTTQKSRHPRAPPGRRHVLW